VVFSGAMFPMPKVALLELGGHALGPFDLLPPTHAVAALNKSSRWARARSR